MQKGRSARSAPPFLSTVRRWCDAMGHAAPAMYFATRPHFEHRRVTWERGGGGTCCGSRTICPEQDGQESGDPVRSWEMSCRACAGLYVAGRGFRMRDLHEYTTNHPDGRVGSVRNGASGAVTRRRLAVVARGVLSILLCGASMGCGPRLHLPELPSTPDLLSLGDTGATLARQLAPVLYLQADETFPLIRAVAVLHPARPLIAYHLLWRDDAHGAWVPLTNPSDQEIVWIGYDSTGVPVDVWTYWHGHVLHVSWPRRQVLIDVQWGKHGSLPRGIRPGSLPAGRSLELFYLLAWAGIPDLWLGRLSRPGPLCFCRGYARYVEFSRPLGVAARLDVIARTEDPSDVLRSVFGVRYSRKRLWP
jgi:hypothetical protein